MMTAVKAFAVVATLVWIQATTASEFIDFEQAITRHLDGRARLASLRGDWQVLFKDGDGETADTETGWVEILGDMESGSFSNSSGRQDYVWSDGELRWMVGYDYGRVIDDPTAVESIRAQLYQADMPAKRLFQGRVLLSFKLITSEHNSNLRQFCESSTSKAEIKLDDGLLRISIVHPGAMQPSGVRMFKGSPVSIWLDPEKGFAAVRQHTFLRDDNQSTEIVIDTKVKQFISIESGLWLPVDVETRIGEQVQLMTIEYREVNKIDSLEKDIFPPATLVREYGQYGDTDARQYFVVDHSGQLGEPIYDEILASKLRYGVLVALTAEKKSTGTTWVVAVFCLSALALVVFLWKRRVLWRLIDR